MPTASGLGFVLDPPPRRRPALPTETVAAPTPVPARERAMCFALICGVMLTAAGTLAWFVTTFEDRVA
jgi:hypothetical protein